MFYFGLFVLVCIMLWLFSGVLVVLMVEVEVVIEVRILV